MNSLLGFFMLFCALSCSTVLWKERGEVSRQLSSLASIESKNVMQLSCFQNRGPEVNSAQLLEFFLIDQHFQVGVGQNSIHFYREDGCQREVHLLDFHDSIVFIDDSSEKLILRTMHGHLIIVGSEGIEHKQLSFPVSSFEIVGDMLHLYSANSAGRFCDYYQLRLPQDKRDNSCRMIAKKQKI